MGLTLVTPPDETAVDCAVFAAYVRVGLEDDNSSLMTLLGAAQDRAEQLCKSRFVEQIWSETHTVFTDGLQLQLNPVIEIESITYIDIAGDAQTVADTVYELAIDNQHRAFVRLKYNQSWPSSRGDLDGITVTYAVGYGDRSNVPESLKVAIMTHAANRFENPEAGSNKIIDPAEPAAFYALMSTYRYYE